jgi:hypothetical protein
MAATPLTPEERLFMEAGYRETDYWAWRRLILPEQRIQAAAADLNSGWPPEDLKERSSDYRLAKRWLEAQQAQRARSAPPPSPQAPRQPEAPRLSSTEVIAQLEPRLVDGFKKQLYRAAERFRKNGRQQPEPLGGASKGWILVEAGSGGHRGAHVLQRIDT